MYDYQDLSGAKHLDYRYNVKGEYHNFPSASKPFRKASKQDPKRGRVCVGCGLVRSVTNKCDCNS